MTRTFTISNEEITLTEVSAINAYSEGERVYGLLLHQASDINCDGDGILFNANMPETAEEAAELISNEGENIDRYDTTLNTMIALD